MARVLGRARLTRLVDVVIGSDDVVRHKPHPEPYLQAVGALGADPAASVAVEDTDVGVASALAAGLYTVAVVRGHVPAAELVAADRVVTTLTLDDLEARRWMR